MIRTTKAYATASTDCLLVVAGVLPIDLYIQRRTHRYRISRGLPTVIGDVIIRVEDYEDPDGIENARKLVEEGMVEVWQKKMEPVSKRKAHVRLLSECRFQTENSVVRGNTLHHTHGHGPRGIQGEIAQAGTGRGLSM